MHVENVAQIVGSLGPQAGTRRVGRDDGKVCHGCSPRGDGFSLNETRSSCRGQAKSESAATPSDSTIPPTQAGQPIRSKI